MPFHFIHNHMTEAACSKGNFALLIPGLMLAGQTSRTQRQFSFIQMASASFIAKCLQLSFQSQPEASMSQFCPILPAFLEQPAQCYTVHQYMQQQYACE